jgi:hypothetical protein
LTTGDHFCAFARLGRANERVDAPFATSRAILAMAKQLDHCKFVMNATGGVAINKKLAPRLREMAGVPAQ